MNPFEIVRLFIGAVFVFVVGSILVNAGRGFSQWTYNNAQPQQSAPARVVTKRAETRGHGSHNSHGRVWTIYFATFELKGGERMEFGLDGHEYGLLAEGDEGLLDYQGTRYLGFRRYSQATI